MKKIAAVGTAIMMTTALSLNVSANYDTGKNLKNIKSHVKANGIALYNSTSFAFYHNRNSSFTHISSTSLGSSSAGKVSGNIYVGDMSSKCYITYEIRVNGVKRGSGKVKRTGNNPFVFYDSDIPDGGNITVAATFHYTGYGCSARGNFIV